MLITYKEFDIPQIVGVKSSYLNDREIKTPDEMPHSVVTNPIGKEWDERIQKEWWYHSKRDTENIRANGKTVDEDIFTLRDKLLSFGGSEVCLPVVEEDLQNILDRGQLWYGDRVRMMKGKPSQCHMNSAYCWYANKEKTVLCTGYALSQDGMWRQHSWLIELRPRKNRVVETTTPRALYFGYPMTRDEANEFYFDNE